MDTHSLIDELTSSFNQRIWELAKEDESLVIEAFDWKATDGDGGAYAQAESSYLMGRQAADALLAPVLWARSIGETLDTTEVTRRLQVTRQALALRVLHHSLLALPGRRSRLYPAWQFGGHDGVWPVVPTLLRRWYQAEPDVEPHTIAVWATTAVRLDDDDVRPAALIASGQRDDLVMTLVDDVIARRTR